MSELFAPRQKVTAAVAGAQECWNDSVPLRQRKADAGDVAPQPTPWRRRSRLRTGWSGTVRSRQVAVITAESVNRPRLRVRLLCRHGVRTEDQAHHGRTGSVRSGGGAPHPQSGWLGAARAHGEHHRSAAGHVGRPSSGSASGITSTLRGTRATSRWWASRPAKPASSSTA